MRLQEIKKTLKSGIKAFLLNLAVRIAWSASISSVLILMLVLVARVLGTTRSIVQIISDSLNLFMFLFSISFFLFFIVYMFSVLEKWKWKPVFYTHLRSRLRHTDFGTRYIVAHGLNWTITCLLLIMLIDILMILREVYAGSIESYFSIGFLLLVALYFVIGIFTGLSRFLMNSLDWTILFLERFKTHVHNKLLVQKALSKAFFNYNKILDSTLSMKKLLSISQYIIEAYKIGEFKDRKDIDGKIDAFIESLKNEQVSEADSRLVVLSESALKIVAQHEKTLGFEVKYPFRWKIVDTLKDAIGKIFTQFMLFLLWILILILLAYLGLLPSFPPSPP